MLRRFKEVREEVVVAFPPGPEGEKPRRVWRKRTAPTAETEWVRRCCEMLSEEVEGDGGEMMAVWSVDVVAGCVYHVIHEDIGGHNFSRGPAYGEMYKIQRVRLDQYSRFLGFRNL